MKKIIRRLISLFKKIKQYSIGKLITIINLFNKFRLFFKLPKIWSIMWSIFKLLISMNLIFAFPVPFLLEPLNSIVKIFSSLFENFATLFIATAQVSILGLKIDFSALTLHR